MLADHFANSRADSVLRTRIAAPDFPCLGAKSALATGKLNVLTCHSLASAWDDIRIHSELLEWSESYRAEPSGLRSLVAVFTGPTDLSEEAFEIAMWDRLQSLADKDTWRGQEYAASVSCDPEDPHFSLSFGGEAFFVVGLHPRASRAARRFPQPTLVFNLHDQFEQLRTDGRYERLRERIVARDIRLDGTSNPMLARHGESSEARQYSGRQVGSDWKCPFRDARAANA